MQLWLALADQHFQLKEIDWVKGQQKCMCDQSTDDNEELGIQIVKVEINLQKQIKYSEGTC